MSRPVMVKTERDPETGLYRALVRVGREPWQIGAEKARDARAASAEAWEKLRAGKLKPLPPRPTT
jgi:hypothetical protein